MSLDQEDINAIAAKTSEYMIANKKLQWVDPETHATHHDWIKQKLIDEEEARKVRQKIIQSAIVWVVPICLSFVGFALWQAFKTAIKN